MTNNILLKHGIIVNPLQSSVFSGDIRINDKIIEEVAESIENKGEDKVFDVSGKLLMPGLVDIHVHISFCPDGHYMLAKAGVTTALDLGGMPEKIIEGFIKCGAGLTLGFLYPLIPGKTLTGADPSRSELEKVTNYALRNGAMGVKILGGHFPLTREATREAIELAHDRQCWIAVHAGTIETPGNICGLEELIQIAGDNPVHIAHVNSFCRGAGKNNPLDEAKRALDALKTVPNCRSESYLAIINGTSGEMVNGIPRSEVTKRSLAHGGYSADLEGMKKAILDGWAKVHYHYHEKHEIIFPEPGSALDFYTEQNSKVMVSFAVNSPLSSIPIAIARDEKGKFIVDALATDGGAIPRNVTLKQGLCLVNFGALSLNELACKACLTPARLLGFKNKGYLAAGASADVIAVDPLTAEVKLVIAEGQVIVQDGKVCGKGGHFISSGDGRKFFREKSIQFLPTEPEWLKI